MRSRRSRFSRRRHQNRRGSVIIIILVMLSLFIAAAGFAVDVAYIQLTQTQLRAATDSAAQAGAEALAEGKSAAEVRTAVKNIAAKNMVAGKGLLIDDANIVLGRAAAGASGKYSFVGGGTPLNAVRVNGLRTSGSASGSVSTMLGRFMGTDSFDASKVATAAIEERDIIVVVDRSGSMNWGGVRHPITGRRITRLEGLKYAVGVFRKVVDETPSVEQIGLVSYSHNVRIDADLDTNYTKFDRKMASMRATGATDIGLGIKDAVKALKSMRRRRHASPVIIVMTDGRHNRRYDPVKETRRARDDDELAGVVVHAVTFSSGADRRRMRLVANEGGGKYLHADDTDDLGRSFDELARTAGSVLIE